MTPLQFQKQLRLQEARRLLLGDDVDAATAGYRVGYEDVAHFSRNTRDSTACRRCGMLYDFERKLDWGQGSRG